jgi:hypothetical protein
VVTYAETRKRQVFFVIGIFVLSLLLEIQRLDNASYELDINDFLWTSRDILWTLIVVYFFQMMRRHYPYEAEIKPRLKKKVVKKAKK